MSVDFGGCHAITSFLDLYAQEKNFKHVSLGRAGATNFLIRLQIEEAIQQDADFVVIGTTSSDRVDLPIQAQAKKIGLPINIRNVGYVHYSSDSANNINNLDPKIISDSLSNLPADLSSKGYEDSTNVPAILEAIKQYTAYMHNNAIATMKDYFIIAEGIRRLLSLNKPFVLIPSTNMIECDWTFADNQLWKEKLPWELPYGFEPTTINHNPQSAHDYFAKILLDMTVEWK
jgi:hypothetical protein